MKTASFACLALILAGISTVGCSQTADESTSSNDSALIGLLSPLSFHNADLQGRWVPVDPADFDYPAKAIEFANDGNGTKTYRLGDACTADCGTPNGSWYIDGIGVIAGYWVHTHAVGGTEKSLFVWNKADGDINLVDVDSWSWSDMSYHATWTKTPTLTVNNLR